MITISLLIVILQCTYKSSNSLIDFEISNAQIYQQSAYLLQAAAAGAAALSWACMVRRRACVVLVKEHNYVLKSN